ncbi:MAG: FHA domain-containing protein [Thermoanaerobaculia bacterium]
MRLTFGDCEVDFGTREAFRKRRLVHLSPKAFLLLELLVQRRPEAVPKLEIHEKIWPATFVSEATLASLIAEIRAALGPALIRTVHGFGYAFQEDERGQVRVASSEEDTEWRIASSDQEVALREGENLFGRDPRAVVRLDFESVSRRHARVVVSPSGATLEDLKSKNGTFLNGKRIRQAELLGEGDEIRLGSAKLRVIQHQSSPPTKTQDP